MNLHILRTPPWLVFFGTTAFLLFCARSALANPPYWDSILGMFHEAIWLFENDFNYWKLAREELGYFAGGARTYYWSWLPGFYALLMHLLPEFNHVFVVLHVCNVLLAAATIGLMVALLRQQVGLSLAVAASFTMCLQPMFMAQSFMIGSDLILACLCLTGFYFYLQRKHGWAIIAMVIAVLVKPTPALMSICLVGGFVLFHLKTRRDGLILAGYLLPVLFFFGRGQMVKVWFFRPETNPASDAFIPVVNSRLEYLREQTVMMFNQIPDVMILVILVIGFHLAVILWTVRKNILRPLTWRAALAPFETPVILVVALGALTFQSVLLVGWLPRYMLFLYPAIFILLALALKYLPPKVHLVLPILLAVFFAANSHGRFYVSPVQNNGYILERSLEYQDDLRLNQELARTLQAEYSDRSILAHWPHIQMLAHPGFGYVSEPLDVIAVSRPALAWQGVPYFGELPVERRRAAKNVWLDGKNIFAVELGIRPGIDRKLMTFQVEDRSADLWEKHFERTF